VWPDIDVSPPGKLASAPPHTGVPMTHTSTRLGHRRIILALFAATSVTACATPNVAPSGFLGSYEALQASDETGAVRVATSSAETLFGYTSVMIDEPSLLEARLSQRDADAMRGALTEALHAELALDREIVMVSAAGTLRVRYAIIQVKTSNVALNALTTVIIGAVDYGALALEAEVTDSVTGERLASMTWARGAKAFNVLGAYSSTGNARALAPDFAKRLAKLISPKMPG
jgi:hypothetical protein